MKKRAPHQSSARPPAADRFAAARLALARLHTRRETTLHQSLAELTRLVAQALGVDRVGIWLMGDDRQSIRCHHLYQSSLGQTFEGAVLHARDFPAYFQALDTTRVVAMDDAHRDAVSADLRTAYLEPLGIGAMLDAPLYRGGHAMGVLCHEHLGAPRAWTEAEQQFAAAGAETVARLFEEAARHEAEFTRDAYQTRLMELHRLEALGRLAAGIAHDFRNILFVIRGQGDLLARSTALPPAEREAADQIAEAARLGHQLTEELVSFGKHTAEAPRVVPLCRLLKETERMLRLSLGPRHHLVLRCASDLCSVFIDPAQFERVVLNLVLNARDAMPRGGEIVLATGERAASGPDGREVQMAFLQVTDAGVGMDAATRARIFEPFFTTKGDKGTGLGLAVTDQIITRAGGFLEVESEPGRGTTMRVQLPRIGHPQPAATKS